MIRKEYVTRLLYTIIISVAIYIGICIRFFPEALSVGMVIKSVGLGALIWLVAELVTEAVSKKWPHHILPSYIALFVIIAIGTGVGTWLMGVTSGIAILLICICAEICGFLIAIVYRYSYQKKLNIQLEKFKSIQKNAD